MNAVDNAGKEVELIVGAWYMGVNISDDAPMIPAPNWHWGAGEIAQYVGDGEFYDDDAEGPTRMQDYDYIVFSHMGKVTA